MAAVPSKQTNTAFPGVPTTDEDPVQPREQQQTLWITHPTLQVLDQLSGDLVISVMRAVPNLPALFRSLPPCMHPLALRAHLPSVDAARTLSATLPDGISAAHTARAAAALPHLTAISLAVSNYRFANELASFGRVLQAIGGAPCGVSLDVARTLPQHSDLPCKIILHNIPNLGRLVSLRISAGSFLPGAASWLPPCARSAAPPPGSGASQSESPPPPPAPRRIEHVRPRRCPP